MGLQSRLGGFPSSSGLSTRSGFNRPSSLTFQSQDWIKMMLATPAGQFSQQTLTDDASKFLGGTGPGSATFPIALSDTISVSDTLPVLVVRQLIDTAITPTAATPTGLTNSAEGGSNGVTVTTANSGGASGNAWTTVAGSPTFQSTQVAHGSLAYNIPTNSETLIWTQGSVSDGYVRAYFYLSASTADFRIFGFLAASIQWRIRLNTSTFIIQNGAGTTTEATGTAVSSGQWYRLELHHNSAAQLEAKLWNSKDSSGAADQDLVAATATNSNIDELEFTSGGAVSSVYLDDLNGFATAWPGPAIGGSMDTLVVAITHTHPIALTDTISITDSLPVKVGRFISDTISITDLLLRIARPHIADTISVTDALARKFGPFLADTISITDALIALRTRALSDTISITDALARTARPSMADTIAVSDLLHTRAGPLLADTITVTDSLKRAIGEMGLIDTISVTESLARRSATAPTDTISVSDSLATTRVRFLADTISVTDALARGGFARSLTDTISLTDAIVKFAVHGLADTIAISDALPTGRNRPLMDSAYSWAFTDTFTRSSSTVFGGSWIGTSSPHFNVDGSEAQAVSVIASRTGQQYLLVGQADVQVQVRMMFDQLPTGAGPVDFGVWVDSDSANANGYRTRWQIAVAGTISNVTASDVATTLATVSSGTPSQGTPLPGEWWWMKVERAGVNLRVKAWRQTSVEPSAWDHDTVDTAVPPGQYVGVHFQTPAGVTNTPTFNWDDFSWRTTDVLVKSVPVLSDTISVSDTLISGRTRPIADTISITDALVKGGAVQRALSDTISVTDAIARRALPLVADSISLSDSIGRGRSLVDDGTTMGDQTLVSDTYTRSVGSGLGTADTGQTYGNFGASSVNGSAAVLPAIANTGVGAFVNGITKINEGGLVKIAFSATPTDTISVFTFLRLNPGFTAYYNVHLYLFSGTTVNLSNTVFTPSTTFAAPGSDVTIDAAWVNTQSYWMRFEVQGNQLRWRAWKDGSGEPTAWMFITTDSSVSTGGTVGFQTFGGAALTAGINVTFDNLLGYNNSDSLLLRPTRPLSDTISVSDSLRFKFGRPISDTISITDALVKGGVSARPISDTISVSDLLARREQPLITDTISVSDSLVKAAVKLIADTISVTDALLRAPTPKLADTIAVSDALASLRVRPLSDTIAVSDGLTLRVGRPIADTIAVTDGLASVVSVVLHNDFDTGQTSGTTITTGNSGATGDNAFNTVAGVPTYDSTIAFAGTLSMACITGATRQVGWSTSLGTQTLLWGRAYGSFASLAGTAIRIVQADGNVTTNLLRIATVAATGALQISVASFGTVTTTHTLTANQWFRIEWKFQVTGSVSSVELKLFLTPTSSTPDETISTSFAETDSSFAAVKIGVGSTSGSTFNFDELNTNNLGYPGPIAGGASRALTDTISITDLLPVKVGRFLAETITVTDTLARRTQVALAETISVTDLLARRVGRPLADTISITDLLPVRVGRFLIDTISITDLLARAQLRTLADTITITDALAALAKRGLVDTISVTDSLPIRVARFLTDTISVTDLLARAQLRSLLDTISITDALVVLAKRGLTDTIAVTDALALRVGRPLTDTISITDSLARRTTRPIADTISVTDALVPRRYRLLADSITGGGAGTTPTVRSSNVAASSATTTLSFSSLPSGAAVGDILMVHVSAVLGSSDITCTTSNLTRSVITNDSTTLRSAVFWRTLTSGDISSPPTMSFSGPSATGMHLNAMCVVGADPTTPVANTASGASSGTRARDITIGGNTGEAAGELVLALIGSNSSPVPWATNNIVGAPLAMITSEQVPGGMVDSTSQARVETAIGFKTPIGHSWYQWDMSAYTFPEAGGSGTGVTSDYENNRLSSISWPSEQTWPGGQNATVVSPNAPSGDTSPSYWLQYLAQGNYDALIYAFMAKLRTWGRAVVFRPFCEMNGGDHPWEVAWETHVHRATDAEHATYLKLAWQRVFLIAKGTDAELASAGMLSAGGFTTSSLAYTQNSGHSADAQNVFFHWNPQAFETSTTNRWDDYWPGTTPSGRAYVDFAGVELYISTGGTWSSTLNQLLHSTTVNSGRTHNSLYDHYIPLTNLNGGGSGETGYRYKSSEASTAAAIARINSIFDGTNGLAFNPLWRFLGYWDGGLETGTNGDSHVDNTGHSDIRTAITTILATGYLRPVLTDTMLSAPSGWTLGKQARRSLDTGSTSAHTNGGPGEVGSIVLWASAPIASATASTVGYGNYTSLSLLVSPISVAGISDTISFTVRPTVPLVDTITITESIQLRTAYKIADTISISDSLARAQPRALADTISITDAIKRRITPLLTDIGAFPNLLLPGGTVLPGGGVVATDCDTLAVTVRRFLADTISVSDSLVRKPTRALIDTIAVSDSLVKYAAKLLADTIAVSDSLARRVTRPLADTIAISDALAKGTLLHLSETISVSDTLASLRVRPITDTISITENLATSASGHKSVTLSDTISVSDALALRTTRLFADSISITDNLTAVAGHRQVALADTIAVSDLLARKGAPQLTDTIAVGTDQTLGADTFSRTVPVGLGIADSGQSYGTFGSGISVGSGVASIPFAANTGIGGYMVGPNSKNTGALMKMGFTALPDDIASSFLLLRLDSGFTHYYNAHLYLTPGGQVVLSRTIFTPSGSFDAGTSDITIDASWVNTQAYWLRFEALGTTLRWKAWKDGSSEPHAWSFVTVDGSVSASGTVGFQTFANAGLTASVQGTFDQLSFYSPGDWITTALPSRHLPLVDTISISDRLQHHVLGTSITAAQTTDPHYAPIVLRSFQSVTPEYEMQWGQVEPSQGTFFWTNVDTITAWAVANRKQVRGHTLIWDGGGDPAMMPPWVTGGSWTSTTLKAALQAHINAVVGRYKGVVRVWHVVNEAFEDDGSRTNWIFQNVIGDSWIELAFQYAYAADPTAKLLYNDYGDDWGYYSLNPKYNAILAMATDFVNRGIPIHGIGFQGHYDLQYTDYPDPADLTGVLSTYAALGLEVHLTELDCRIDNVADPMATRLTNQATVYRNARNGLVGAQGDYINIWGISDATNWLGPTAASAPLDTRYIEKPAWRQINDFVEPATFYPGLTDTISVSDALTTKRTHALADAISISDALSVRHPRTLADSISVTDSLRRTPGPRLADTIVISDSLRAQVGKRNLADAISVSDALNVGPARRLNDSLSVTDSLKSLRIRRLDDTIAISDRIKGQQILHDGFQVSDLLTFVGTFLELQAFFTLRDFAAVRFLTADFAAVGFTSITRRFARSTTAEKLVGFTSRDFRATDTVLTEEPDTV